MSSSIRSHLVYKTDLTLLQGVNFIDSQRRYCLKRPLKPSA